MRIGELAVRSGVSARALRHYERLGLLHPQREDNAYRTYSDEDATRARAIRTLLRSGFSLDEMRAFESCLANDPREPEVASRTLELFRGKMLEIETKIAGMLAFKEALARRVQRLEEIARG